jgi:hypothetical protein
VVVSNLLDAQAAYAENGEVGEQDRPITSDPSLKVLPLDLLERIGTLPSDELEMKMMTTMTTLC